MERLPSLERSWDFPLFQGLVLSIPSPCPRLWVSERQANSLWVPLMPSILANRRHVLGSVTAQALFRLRPLCHPQEHKLELAGPLMVWASLDSALSNMPRGDWFSVKLSLTHPGARCEQIPGPQGKAQCSGREWTSAPEA